jgi:hypothetical protein
MTKAAHSRVRRVRDARNVLAPWCMYCESTGTTHATHVGRMRTWRPRPAQRGPRKPRPPSTTTDLYDVPAVHQGVVAGPEHASHFSVSRLGRVEGHQYGFGVVADCLVVRVWRLAPRVAALSTRSAVVRAEKTAVDHATDGTDGTEVVVTSMRRPPSQRASKGKRGRQSGRCMCEHERSRPGPNREVCTEEGAVE